jgi:hypothetical protein
MRRQRQKKGESESFALSLCREQKISLKISHKGQKRRKKASFHQGRKYSLSVLSV